MNYAQLIETEDLAKTGDTDAIITLAKVYETEIGRIRFPEAVRKFHLLVHRVIALQLSQECRPLLDKAPAIATSVNAYKDAPSMQNLQTMLQVLTSTGKIYGEDVFIKICYIISKAFQTLAKEFDNILCPITGTSTTSNSIKSVQDFKANPSFKTFIECIKALNTRFKDYTDSGRAKELLFHLVSKNDELATKMLIDNYSESKIVIIRRSSNNSLLGYSYSFSTIWDKAEQYSTISI